MRTLLTVCLLHLAMTAAGCSSDEFVRAAGQTLYNSGRYFCAQSSHCDADGEPSPSATSNRR